MARRPARKAEARESGDVSQYLRLLELHKQHSDWDEYLALAMSQRFQEDLAAEASRVCAIDATGPLGVLEVALDQAVRLRRIGDAAALTLAAARWTRRLSVRTALGVGVPRGEAAEAECRTGHDVLRTMLRAWERYDAGNRGEARELLGATVGGRPPLIRTGPGDRWAVPLLRQAFVIDPDAAANLLRLVDDNVLGDLARELTAAGEYAHARTAGTAIRLFFQTKADVLADLALAQAEAALKQGTARQPETTAILPLGKPIDLADWQAVAETANQAADAARQAQQERSGVAGKLAKAAAALTLSGEHALATGRWAEAMAAVGQDPDPAQACAEFARALVRAGLLDDAEQVIAVMLNETDTSADDWQGDAVRDPAWRAVMAACHDVLDLEGQAAAALVGALAENGDVARAITVLRMIPDFAYSYPRAVRALAGAVARTDVTEAERLARLVRDPYGRGAVLAAVAAAALTAGNQRDAVRVVDGIEDPSWRAQALVGLAGAPGQPAGIPIGKVRDAIAAVTDINESAVLLIGYAMTQDIGERRRLLADATRLVGKAPADARWRVLANIGATSARAGLTVEAREAFTAARRLLARDADERDFALYQLCQAQLSVGDAAGARETAAVAIGAMPGRTTARRLWSAAGAATAAPASRRAARRARSRTPVPDSAHGPAIAAAEAAADIPIAVAALAAIACAIGEAGGPAVSGSARAIVHRAAGPDAGDEPGATAGQIERVLAEAARLATELRGAGAIVAEESLAQAYTALGYFAAAERRILSLLPRPDPGAEQNAGRESAAADDDVETEAADDAHDADPGDDAADMDENADDPDETEDEIRLITVALERSTALADALVAAGEAEHAARFMREVADRLCPYAWRLGAGDRAADMLAGIAAAQVRAGDSDGARTTAAFAAAVASATNAAFRPPEPLGLPMADQAGTVAAVVDAMTALVRDAGVGPADFARAGQSAVDYARRPWQARAHILTTLARTRADPAERARIAALLAGEQEQIWQLATVTFVRGATLDPDDAARALAALAAAEAGIGELADARRAIARAREMAADIEHPAERARSLAEVALSLSAIGDHAAAISTAREIDQPAYQGQAIAAAITAAANAGGAVGGVDLTGEARTIKDEGWRAIALAGVALAGASPLDFAEAHELIGQVAHGSPRSQVWHEVIGLCVAAGRYGLAVDLTDKITDDVGGHLAVIAATLGLHAAEAGQPPGGASAPQNAAAQQAAGDAMLRLLPRCARYPEAAYAACAALAVAFPADAGMIAGAVAQHAAAPTTAAGNHGRG